MILLPGLGEAAPPATVRIGLALGITLLLLPIVAPLVPPVPEAGLRVGLMVGGEIITGLWFGWVARLFALALPMAAQFISYMLGISNVLQPDPELGAQSSALARLFEVAAPLATPLGVSHGRRNILDCCEDVAESFRLQVEKARL